MLSTKNITFAYHQHHQFYFPDIELSQGNQALLLGNSGSGKTTYLHLIGGLLRPENGKIVVNGQTITAMSDAQLDIFRGRNIGLIFQRAHFLPALTVRENLQLAQHLAGLPQDRARIIEGLERLGIAHKLNARIQQLSEGEKQRVAICLALLNKPSLILADEPTSSLDDYHAAQVAELLREQAQAQKATLLIVTHDQRLKQYFEHKISLQTDALAV